VLEIASFSEIESELIERVHKTVWCNVATIDTRNRVRSRLLHPIWENATAWVGTRRNSLKAKHIEHNPSVSLAYIADVVKPIYVDCFAQWEDESAVRRHIWELFRSAPPPLGFDFGTIFGDADNPEFGLLKLTPWRVELGDATDPKSKRIWTNREVV
jgi:general stress protein 26